MVKEYSLAARFFKRKMPRLSVTSLEIIFVESLRSVTKTFANSTGIVLSFTTPVTELVF
jgi:hypothetical protein